MSQYKVISVELERRQYTSLIEAANIEEARELFEMGEATVQDDPIWLSSDVLNIEVTKEA